MALSPSLLENLIYSQLKAKHPTYFPEVQANGSQNSNVDRMCHWMATLAEPVITHIISNALVTVAPGILVVTIGGPTTQSGSSVSNGLGTIS